MCNADNGQAMSMCVNLCERAAFALEEQCSQCSSPSSQWCSILICHTSEGIHLQSNTLFFLWTTTDSERVFPQCLPLWCAKQIQTQVLVSVID